MVDADHQAGPHHLGKAGAGLGADVLRVGVLDKDQVGEAGLDKAIVVEKAELLLIDRGNSSVKG